MNLVNLIPLDANEKIQAVLYINEFAENNYLIMGTKKGLIKKTSLDKYSSIRKNGLNAINLKEDDELISVRVTTGECQIIYVTKNGYAIRFDENDVRPIGRTASGVKAIDLREDDEVVGMEVAEEKQELLVVSENGYGKRTHIEAYTLQRRGGKGVITYKISDKTGKVIGARIVSDEEEIMLINTNGIAIRINVSGISSTSRNAMGVTLMKTTEDEKVVTMSKVNITGEDIEDTLDDEVKHNETEDSEANSDIAIIENDSNEENE
jgi:Type IIA topoisomerase (DNA gyrase/topo II, topoisomerase IV), A subunit